MRSVYKQLGLHSMTLIEYCCEYNIIIYTHYAGVHRVRGVQLAAQIALSPLFGIYRDPAEEQGQGLEAGGQPALRKTCSPWPGTLRWTVRSNR